MIETPPKHWVPQTDKPRTVARLKNFDSPACFFTFPTGNGTQFITINLTTIISINWYMEPEADPAAAPAPVLATVQTQDDIIFDVANDNAVALWSCLAT